MKIMQLSKRKGETGGAPRQTEIMGQPHMLAYINEAERQMLKRAGGSELPGPEGIPSYLTWNDIKQAASDTWSEITSGGGAQTETYNGGSSNNSSSLPKTSTSTANANKQAAESMKSVGVTSLSGHSTDNDKTNNSNSISNSVYTIPVEQRAVIPTTANQGYLSDRVDKLLIENYGWKMGPNGDAVSPQDYAALQKNVIGPNTSGSTQTDTSVANANKGMAESMFGMSILSLDGKPVPAAPANPGNPPILEYDGSDGEYSFIGPLNTGQPASVSTNEDGSIYHPTDNEVNNANVRGVNDLINTGDDGGLIKIEAPNGVAGTVDYVNGNGVEVAGPTGVINTINEDGEYTPSGDSTVATDVTTVTPVVDDPPSEPVAPPVNQPLIDALARRDAALATQMGNIESAFGFSTDDYYTGLGDSYRDGGLSEAFTTAYDDATRGIYDTFKSAGMLTQQGVDDSMGILAGAEGGEEGRIDGIVNQYTTANRNFVNDGRSGMEGTLQGFVTETEDVPTIDTQTAQIMGYDVAGNSQPFKTPKEKEVVDFFTDFVKRSYDPSYNVDPTAVASGGPSRVSGSVDRLGAGTQPSTIAGILDPIAGGSVKVIG
jgi:hypothetical protein